MSMKFNISGTEELKNEFRSIRNELQAEKQITVTQFKQHVTSIDPEFDCEEGEKRIHDVYYGRSTSLTLLNHLIDYKNEKHTV